MAQEGPIQDFSVEQESTFTTTEFQQTQTTSSVIPSTVSKGSQAEVRAVDNAIEKDAGQTSVKLTNDQINQLLQSFNDIGKETDQNPLRQFRSYNYQFVLFACIDSATLEFLSDTGLSDTNQDFSQAVAARGGIAGDGNFVTVDKFSHPPEDGKNPYAKYDIIKPDNLNGLGYSVIINSALDADLLIESLELNNIISPPADRVKDGAAWGSITTDAKMMIHEPFGARFIEIISYVATQFNVEPYLLTFGIKPYFVGYRDELGEKSKGGIGVLSCRPFTFSLVDISGNLDLSGTKYDITMLSLMNGLAGLPAFSNVGGFTYTLPTKDPTIETATDKLVETLNQISTESWEAKVNDIRSRIDQNIVEEPRKVQYDIVFVDEFAQKQKIEEFKNYKLRSYSANNCSVDAPCITTTKGTSVAQMIEQLLALCPQLQEERTPPAALQTIQNKRYYSYKIVNYPIITDEELVIVYVVIKSEMPVAPPPKATDPATQKRRKDFETQLLQEAIENDNVLVFDYLFSGRNVDLLRFDMKLNTGLTSLYAYHMQKNNISTTNVSTSTSSSYGIVSHDSQLTSGKGVVAVSRPSEGSSHSSADPAGINSYYQFLSKYSFLETVSVSADIHGNPRLLNAFMRQPTDYQHLVDGTERQDKSTVGEVMRKWESAPGIVKINIFWPSKNSLSHDDYKPGETFKQPFWYDGVFMLVGVKHIFKGDKFIQTLNLLALPTETSIPGFSVPTAGALHPAQPTIQAQQSTKPPKQNPASGNTPVATNSVIKRPEFPGLSGQELTNLKAFLYCIRRGEGTADELGYYRFVGGKLFTGIDSDHPSNVDPIAFAPTRLPKQDGTFRLPAPGSSAAGAYQITRTTWNKFLRSLRNSGIATHLPDFKPETQDLAAYFLIKEKRQALSAVVEGDLETAFNKLHLEWTSLPGGSEARTSGTKVTGRTFQQAQNDFIAAGGTLKA